MNLQQEMETAAALMAGKIVSTLAGTQFAVAEARPEYTRDENGEVLLASLVITGKSMGRPKELDAQPLTAAWHRLHCICGKSDGESCSKECVQQRLDLLTPEQRESMRSGFDAFMDYMRCLRGRHPHLFTAVEAAAEDPQLDPFKAAFAGCREKVARGEAVDVGNGVSVGQRVRILGVNGLDGKPFAGVVGMMAGGEAEVVQQSPHGVLRVSAPLARIEAEEAAMPQPDHIQRIAGE